MSPTNSSMQAGRRPQPASAETPWIILGVVLTLVVLAALIWWAAAALDSELRQLNPYQDPINLVVGQFTGSLPVTSGQLLYFTIGFGSFVLLGLLERATDGYGIDGYFAYLDWVWVDGPLAAGLIYFICVMLFFVVGFLSATIYQRFGTFRLVLGMIVIALALVGLGALITWQQAWPELWTWILQTGALGLSLWAALATAVLATLSYLALRRLPA